MMGNKDEQVWKHSETGVCAVLVSSMSNSSGGPKILDFHAITANKGFDEGVK